MTVQLFSTTGAAALAGLKPKTIREAICDGRLRSIKRNGRRLIDRQDLLDFLRRRPLSDDMFAAEWNHFTQVLGMSHARAVELLADRYRLGQHRVQERVRHLAEKSE